MKTFPYWAEPGQVKGTWVVRVQEGKASVAVASGSEAEMRVAAEAWNWLARGRKVKVVVVR